MPSVNSRWLRLGALALLVVLTWWLGWASGLTDQLNKEDLRAAVLEAGPWGVLLFVALNCLGIFIYLPGVVFVTGAVLIYGYWLGMLVAFAGGLMAISVSFAITRSVGGAPLVKVRRPRLRALLSKLHRKPVVYMSLLRVFMQTSPALNTILSLSGVRYRDYLAAALIGMWVPIVVTSTAVQFFLD